MSRLVAVTLLFVMAFVISPGSGSGVADLVGGSSPVCPELSLETTFLCVSLTFIVAGATHHGFVVVDWGDGTSDWPDCVGGGSPCLGRVPHTYAAAGTYTITVTALTGCPGGINSIVADVSASPEFPLYPKSAGGSWIQPATTDPLDIAKLRRSTIDWGDGTSIEEFEWVGGEAGELCGPRHDYALPGEYTIVARVEYLGAWGGTCYERVGKFDAVVGTPTATESRTWGGVKALYR